MDSKELYSRVEQIHGAILRVDEARTVLVEQIDDLRARRSDEIIKAANDGAAIGDSRIKTKINALQADVDELEAAGSRLIREKRNVIIEYRQAQMDELKAEEAAGRQESQNILLQMDELKKKFEADMNALQAKQNQGDTRRNRAQWEQQYIEKEKVFQTTFTYGHAIDKSAELPHNTFALVLPWAWRDAVAQATAECERREDEAAKKHELRHGEVLGINQTLEFDDSGQIASVSVEGCPVKPVTQFFRQTS